MHIIVHIKYMIHGTESNILQFGYNGAVDAFCLVVWCMMYAGGVIDSVHVFL